MPPHQVQAGFRQAPEYRGLHPITVPFQSFQHVTPCGSHCCIKNQSVSQVTVGHIQVTMSKGQKIEGQRIHLKQVFFACFANFGLLLHLITCKTSLKLPI
jgi:hypothetical protein